MNEGNAEELWNTEFWRWQPVSMNVVPLPEGYDPPEGVPNPEEQSSSREHGSGHAGPSNAGSGFHRSSFRRFGNHANKPSPRVCQAEDCGRPASGRSATRAKNALCRDCSGRDAVTVRNQQVRFCQSCKNIHLLESFDGKNRSCRSSLAKARLKSKQRKHEEYHAIAAYQQQASVQPPLEQAAGALGGGFEQAGHQINQAYLAAQQPQQHDQNASPWLNVHNVQPTAQMPFVQEYELPGNASHSDDLLVPPTAPSSHNMGQMRAGLASAVQPLSEEGYEIAQLLHEQIGAASSETEINEAEQIVCPLLHEGQREQQQQQDGNGLGLELHSICAKLFSSTPDQLSPNIRDAIIGWLQRFPTSVASFLRPSCTQLLCDMCVASDAWMGELPLNSELERFDRLRMDGQDVKEQLALKDIEPAVCVLDEDMLSIKCQTTHDTLERYMEIRCADDGNAYGIPLRPMHFEGKCATCVAETQPKYTGLPRWAGCVMQALEFSHSERNELRSEVWPLVIVPDPKVQREVAAATFALQKLVQKDRRKLGAFLVLLGRAFAGNCSSGVIAQLVNICRRLGWHASESRAKEVASRRTNSSYTNSTGATSLRATASLQQ